MQELTKKIEEMLQRIEALEQRAHVKTDTSVEKTDAAIPLLFQEKELTADQALVVGLLKWVAQQKFSTSVTMNVSHCIMNYFLGLHFQSNLTKFNVSVTEIRTVAPANHTTVMQALSEMQTTGVITVHHWGRNQFDPTVIEVFFNKLLNK